MGGHQPVKLLGRASPPGKYAKLTMPVALLLLVHEALRASAAPFRVLPQHGKRCMTVRGQASNAFCCPLMVYSTTKSTR